jgi:hypothetical protein
VLAGKVAIVRSELWDWAGDCVAVRAGGREVVVTARRQTQPLDNRNAWVVFDDHTDRVAAQCVSALAPEWSTKLAAFDVYVWDQCYAMEQTLRIE